MLTILVSLSIAMFIPLFLAIGSIKYRAAQFGQPDIQHPRDQAAKLTGAGQRIIAAQHNAWEALALFVTALVICTLSGVQVEQLSSPALLFIGARIAHAVFYIAGRGELRFVAFFASVVSLIWMLTIAFTSL